MNHRKIFLSASAIGLSLALTSLLPAAEPSPGNQNQTNGLSPAEALLQLKEGNARFATDQPREAELGSKRRIEHAQGQRPIAVVLTCSDSRAAPEIVFDKGLGVIFVVRVAGNVGGPEVFASIEYALAVLKAPLIVVLGHKNCGAVDAALKSGSQPTDNLQHLVDLIHTGEDLPHEKHAALDAAIRNNVLYQAETLTTHSDVIRKFEASGKVKIVPAIYDLTTGKVEWIEPLRK